MIKYNNPITTQEGYTLSIDKVRLVFKFKSERDSLIFRLNLMTSYKSEKTQIITQFFAHGLASVETESGREYQITKEDYYKERPDFTIEEYASNSLRYGTYRFMYSIHPFATDKETIVVAHFLNNGKNTKLEGFIEFNPNKCAGEVLEWILKTLRLHCSYLILKRYDLALDVPIIGSSITLHKDERKYELHKPSSDPSHDTEYLGVRNDVGRFKKYNKKIEHNKRSNADDQINEEVTRLEITLNTLDYKELCRLFPKVEVMRPGNDLFEHINYANDIESLCATDKVLLQLLSESEKRDFYFSQLGRDKRKKLEPFLYRYFQQPIIIHEKDFLNCISKMLNYLQLFNTNAPTKLIHKKG